MNNAHIFDIDTLIEMNSMPWIVDKTTPNAPLMKIPMHEFNLIKSGIYRSQNNKVEFNGRTYWLPSKLVNELKVTCKLSKVDFSNLAISLQEFINKEIINELDYKLKLENINFLSDKNTDVYIICSKQTKNKYEVVLNKLEESLREINVKLKKFYYISETFYNIKNDDIKYKKLKVLLQNLVGYKIEKNCFIDEEYNRYDEVYYYDNNYDTLKFSDDLNTMFNVILRNTQDGLKNVIKEDISQYKPSIIVNQINENVLNNKIIKRQPLVISNIIKTFESFNRKY